MQLHPNFLISHFTPSQFHLPRTIKFPAHTRAIRITYLNPNHRGLFGKLLCCIHLRCSAPYIGGVTTTQNQGTNIGSDTEIVLPAANVDGQIVFYMLHLFVWDWYLRNQSKSEYACLRGKACDLYCGSARFENQWGSVYTVEIYQDLFSLSRQLMG
jgi:hypothetical protein